MSEKPSGLDDYVQAAAAMTGLPIPDASKPIVREHLEIAARLAAVLEGFDLDQREEPAPVFRPQARS